MTARILNFVGPTNEFELEARRCGYRRIAGLDEAGRGPMAGPVVASAVVLPSRCRLIGCDDSKLLSESEREQLYVVIRKRAVSIGIGSATERRDRPVEYSGSYATGHASRSRRTHDRSLIAC